MRYCYTEAGKAEITLELTIADLQETAHHCAGCCGRRKFKLSDPPAVAMTWPRLKNPPRKASVLLRIICCVTWRATSDGR
jgi:hypothetical protein